MVYMQYTFLRVCIFTIFECVLHCTQLHLGCFVHNTLGIFYIRWYVHFICRVYTVCTHGWVQCYYVLR